MKTGRTLHNELYPFCFSCGKHEYFYLTTQLPHHTLILIANENSNMEKLSGEKRTPMFSVPKSSVNTYRTNPNPAAHRNLSPPPTAMPVLSGMSGMSRDSAPTHNLGVVEFPSDALNP